jgi:hypothetical protein
METDRKYIYSFVETLLMESYKYGDSANLELISDGVNVVIVFKKPVYFAENCVFPLGRHC